MFYREKKLLNYHRSPLLSCYMISFTLFIEDVLQNSWRTTAPIKVHPKLIFRGTLKKAVMVLKDRSYETQYFAISLPQPISFNAANSFLSLYLGIRLECALNSHNCQKCNLQCTRKCTRNYSRNYAFYAISQKPD